MIEFKTAENKNLANTTLFLIPSYQRGYRWQAEDAQKLLQDLTAFSGTDYCLQPLELQVATRPSTLPDSAHKNYIRVVDGQQRLTTLCIIAKQLNVELNWKIYYLTEEKHLSDLLQDDYQKDTINAHFRNEVESTVKDFVKDFAEKDRITEYFGDARNIVFPVHFLLDENTEAEESDKGQNAFKRLNAGKTPLTPSELIRALYMLNDSGLDEQQRMEISKEWELIENTLSNEQFWLMFNAVGLEKTPTRIDLLFALVLDIDLKVAKNNPRVIYEKLESGYYKKDYDLLKVWEQVLRCFWWMQSCYEDIECFNYLGWLALCTDIQASTIYADFVKYQKMDVFKKALIKGISDKGLCDVQQRYGDPRLKDLLLLCNVLECNNNQERLRFDRLDTYDIEHIDSQTPNDLSKPEDRQAWLTSVWSEYRQLRNNLSQEEFCVQENIEEIIAEVARLNTEHAVKDGNGLGNLVLLNSHINRSYKNAVFPAKRKVIRQALEQGTQYILPCTAKAFMKFYTEDAAGMDCWLQQDYEGYQNTMIALLDGHFSKPAFRQTSDDLCADEYQKFDLAPDAASIFKAEEEQGAVKKTGEKRLTGEVTFEQLMGTYEIRIPKIQRLYVQGRPDSFGRKCLNDFASVLVDSVSNGTLCPLDMIYGIADGNVFYPLDGQQRLTTLLLLYWLCGKSRKASGEKWVFDYESRRITELFIRNLLNTPSPDFGSTCTEYLEKQAWFIPIWKRDPGIAGMLNMLDSLYAKLKEAKAAAGDFNFDNMTFSINYLDAAVREYDHIFLKMNSRGRPLTAWENVKAVLDKYVPETFPTWKWDINLTWPERIWERVNKDINTLDSNLLTIIGEALKYAGYKDKADDTFQLDKWMAAKETDAADKFFTCAGILLSATEIKDSLLLQAITPSWETAPLMPDFGKVDALCKKHLAAYYAASKNTSADWMRVIWNIIENSEIGNDLPGALKLIDELAKHSGNILEFLKSDAQVQSKFARTQLPEERRKAKLICANADQFPNIWYLRFKEAEAHPFLKGRLAVLLEAAGENQEAFVKCLGHCRANLVLCEDKPDSNAKEQKMLDFFRSYLLYAQDCDLPLEYDPDFFVLDKWKSMFFRDTNKNGVIAWLKSFVDETVPKNNTDWAANLLEHWNEFFPDGPNEYKKLMMYRSGWGNNKVFLYRTQYISGAQLISKSLRAELFEGLYGAAVPWNYHYRGYDLTIELKNGLKIVHRPDDTVTVCQNKIWLNIIGDFSLPVQLTPDTRNEFIRTCLEYPANCSPEE